MTTTNRTCDELGLCQGRTPPCATCPAARDGFPTPTFPFAPGVIDSGPKPVRRWRWSDAAGALGLVALAYFLAGWLL